MEQIAAIKIIRVEIWAETTADVAARILDLFTAQSMLPMAFGFRLTADGLRVEIELGSMPEERRTILLAKMRQVAGVRWLRAA